MSLTASPETAQWLKGPGLAAWLERHGLTSPSLQLGHHARRVRDWKHGGTASVQVADEVLVKLGYHLSELPDDLWLERNPNEAGRSSG